MTAMVNETGYTYKGQFNLTNAGKIGDEIQASLKPDETYEISVKTKEGAEKGLAVIKLNRSFWGTLFSLKKDPSLAIILTEELIQSGAQTFKGTCTVCFEGDLVIMEAQLFPRNVSNMSPA